MKRTLLTIALLSTMGTGVNAYCAAEGSALATISILFTKRVASYDSIFTIVKKTLSVRFSRNSIPAKDLKAFTDKINPEPGCVSTSENGIVFCNFEKAEEKKLLSSGDDITVVYGWGEVVAAAIARSYALLDADEKKNID